MITTKGRGEDIPCIIDMKLSRFFRAGNLWRNHDAAPMRENYYIKSYLQDSGLHTATRYCVSCSLYRGSLYLKGMRLGVEHELIRALVLHLPDGVL